MNRLQRIIALIEEHERNPRYGGRRSIDKSCGEVYEITDPDCIPAEGYPVVATIGTPLNAEANAMELAQQMSRAYLAKQILNLWL